MTIYHSQKNPFLDRRPFVYAIMWSDLNTAYIGMRYGKSCHPNDLWTSYFTSSEYVAAFRAEHGEPDHIEIIDTFLTGVEAQEAEYEIISSFDLHNNPLFLNRGCGKPNGMLEKTVEWRAKLSAALIGRKRSPEECAAISAGKTGKSHKPHSPDTRTKIGNGNRGKVRTAETREKLRQVNLGKKRGPTSEETRRKISEAKRRRDGTLGEPPLGRSQAIHVPRGQPVCCLCPLSETHHS